MILTRRERYASRIHREINARTEKQKRKHSYNELDSIIENVNDYYDKVKKKKADKLDAQKKRLIKKEEKFKFELEFLKTTLKKEIIKHLTNENLQVCLTSTSSFFIENYTKKIETNVIKQKYISDIYKFLQLLDKKRCDTIMFVLHNNKLRVLKYKNFQYVSEITSYF